MLPNWKPSAKPVATAILRPDSFRRGQNPSLYELGKKNAQAQAGEANRSARRSAALSVVMFGIALSATAPAQQDKQGGGHDEAPATTPTSVPARNQPPITQCDTGAIVAKVRNEVPTNKQADELRKRLSTPPPLPRLNMAMPALKPRRTVLAQGERPDYYVVNKSESRMGIRAAPGIGVELGGSPGERVAFSFDSSVYGRIALSRRAMFYTLWPEAGYWLLHRKSEQMHAAAIGLGASWQYGHYAVGILPQFVVGSSQSQLTLGVRPKLMAELGRGLLAVNMSYGFLQTAGVSRHFFVANASVDVLALGLEIGSGYALR